MMAKILSQAQKLSNWGDRLFGKENFYIFVSMNLGKLSRVCSKTRLLLFKPGYCLKKGVQAVVLFLRKAKEVNQTES